MNAYLTFRLSENIGETPEGYLVCRGTPVSRTAMFEPLLYRKSEIGLGSSDTEVRVWRSPEALFDRETWHRSKAKQSSRRIPAAF